MAKDNYSRSGGRKVAQSMPDVVKVIADTTAHTGIHSGFMKLSSSTPVFDSIKVNGEELTNVDLLPDDQIIPCNVTYVKLTSGAIALWSE